MPSKTNFSSKWLVKLDNTGKLCSRWLTKGKTSNSFRCIVCNTDDLSCANGGWIDIKKHFDRPKHIQSMRDVFNSISLIAPASNSSSSTSTDPKDNNTHTTTSSTGINITKTPFVSIQNHQKALTHEESKSSQLSFLYTLISIPSNSV
jgi:hypothetical protein